MHIGLQGIDYLFLSVYVGYRGTSPIVLLLIALNY